MGSLDAYKENFILLGMENKFEMLELLSRKDYRVMEITEYAKYASKDEVFDVIFMAEKQTWCANGIIALGSVYRR